MVTMYQVGPDDISEYGCESYQWVVYWYEVGDYCGSGEAVSFDGSEYRTHSLGHCSCYGPSEGMESGDVTSLDSIIGDSLAHGQELKPEVIAKVRELTA